MAAQSTIAYNTNHLTINCGYNYYWVGMHGTYLQSFTYCNGSFAQTGWDYHLSNGSPVFHAFTYYQTLADQPGCGPSPLEWTATAQTQTYEVSTLGYPYGSCSTGQITYYAGGNVLHQDCTDWARSEYVSALTERTGSTSHIGAISYQSTEYCSIGELYGCTPNTTVTPNFNNIAAAYVDPDGFSVTLSPSTDFKTCDSRDFTTATCPSA